MTVRWASVRRIAVNAFETVAFPPFTVVLYRLDLIGRSPWWLLCTLMFGGGLFQQPGVQRWLAAGDLPRRVPLRIALVANFRDVTERRAAQEKLAYDASHDGLTRR